MNVSILLLFIFVAGAVGGLVNSLLSNNGFILPRCEEKEKTRIFRPGVLGNVIIGGVGATVSWGLYGPFSAAYIVGGLTGGSQAGNIGLTLSSLFGAVLIGIGGARWLTNEVDKKLLRAAASEAAAGEQNEDRARQILVAPPAEAFRIATE